MRLNPGAVRELGLTAPQLASSLRAYVNGEIATYWTTSDGQQVEVQLRLPATQRERIDQLRHLPVAFSKDGAPILLDTVATIVPVVNPEVIRRQNLQRREAIFAGVEGRPAGDAGKDVQELVDGIKLPPGFSFDVGGQTKEQQDAFAAMLAALGLSVIFIYIVLASQFGSFLQPLAIMASLPLSLIGVMLALLLWRSTLNVFSMIGLIMLMGLVTKNAILLVDFANQGRKAGLNIPDALLQAGLVRMRPDHHDHQRDGVRHAAARTRVERRRRDPGADGARDHRRHHHVDIVDAGGGAGAVQLPGARAASRWALSRCLPLARCGSTCRRRRTDRPMSSVHCAGAEVFPPSRERRRCDLKRSPQPSCSVYPGWSNVPPPLTSVRPLASEAHFGLRRAPNRRR